MKSAKKVGDILRRQQEEQKCYNCLDGEHEHCTEGMCRCDCDSKPTQEEHKCCEKCTYHAGIPPAKKFSQLYGTEFCGYKDCSCHQSPQPADLEKRKEIIGWMNYGIPRGKTIPNFEDLLDSFIRTQREEAESKGYKKAEKRVQAFYKCRKTGKLGREDMKKTFLNARQSTFKEIEEIVEEIREDSDYGDAPVRDTVLNFLTLKLKEKMKNE